LKGLLLTAVVIAVAWFWSSSLRARESAVAMGARACRTLGVQFLDDTVALKRIGLGRNRNGRMILQRVYGFEFTQNGSRRYEGQVALHSDRIQAVHLDHPEGPVILQPEQLE